MKTQLRCLLGSLDLCTETALSPQRKPKNRRSSRWVGREGGGEKTVPCFHRQSPSPASSRQLENTPTPRTCPAAFPGLAGLVLLLAQVPSCLSCSRSHSVRLSICSFVYELECGFLGSSSVPGSGPGSPKQAGPMSLPLAEALWMGSKTGIQTHRYR